MTERRRFNTSERVAAYLIAGGNCEDCGDDDKARDALDEAIKKEGGAPIGNKNAANGRTTVDNIHSCSESRPTGTSQAAALRRLRKSAPKLHEKVIAGEMSANAAMVKAGFRPKTITIPVDVEKAARVLVKNFQEDTDKLIEAIQRLAK